MHVPEKYSCRLLVLLMICLLSLSAWAQVGESTQKLIDTTNRFYKASDLLNLGEVYNPDHIYAKGHPYFITDDYTLASLTVNNTVFEEIKARYNIVTDQVIIKATVDSGLLVNTVTKEDWVHSFKINDHFFVSVSKLYPDKNMKGYCEEVYKGNQAFFIKYRKKFVDTYNDNSPEGFFSVVKINKYIYDKGKFIPVDSKRAFLQVYQDRKLVKKFMRENKIRYSKATTAQLNALMKFCDGLPKSA
jgi:hypothetical protein